MISQEDFIGPQLQLEGSLIPYALMGMEDGEAIFGICIKILALSPWDSYSTPVRSITLLAEQQSLLVFVLIRVHQSQ